MILHNHILTLRLYISQEDAMMNQQCVMSASVSDNTRNRHDVKLLALCREYGNRMSVVGIFPECSAGYAEATEELFRYASSVGARLTVLYSTQPAAALLEYVRNNAVTHLIIDGGYANGAGKLISHMLPEVDVSSESVDCAPFGHVK